MRGTWVFASLVLLTVFAGCIQDDPQPSTGAAGDPDTFYSDDRITIENISDIPLQAPTLDEAPAWRLGEWWKIELTDYFVGDSYSSYRVVAGAEKTDYLVGMPTHDFSNDLMVLHVPGFGQIGKTDLSFEVHDCAFHPLKFPLAVDETWETQFECRDVTATVVSVEGMKATVELVGANDLITVVYDAEVRAITSMELAGYASYKVVEHGFDFHLTLPQLEGVVTVPHMHDVIFMHGRIAGALWSMQGSPVGLGPYTPMDSVEVGTTYDRVSFVILLGNLWSLTPVGALPAGGHYRETATAPDGTSYDLVLMPDEPVEWKIGTYKHDAPGGVWDFQHVAAGPGLAMAEGIAYHVYDVELPSGRILPSVGEHQHGSHDEHHLESLGSAKFSPRGDD